MALAPEQQQVALQLADRVEAVDQQQVVARPFGAQQGMASGVRLDDPDTQRRLRQQRQRRLPGG
ncbi:hypothetical protein D3C73_1503170 [compost metagenome]